MTFKKFKQVVFQVCRALNGTVLEMHEGGITPNFHAAHVRSNGTDYYVLCSYENHWAYSSFFSATEWRLDFVDFPEFSELLLTYYDIEPHTSKELYQPFTNQSNELESDVKYWKPRIEGDGLFNWWD